MKRNWNNIIRLLPDPKWDLCWFLAVFLLLTAWGITGSSLGWLKSYSGMAGVIRLEGEQKIGGVYRGIRGDEFIAHAVPYALMQYQTRGEFPVINDKVGLSGRNMLVLHDTASPVYHPAILARPATWGFFFLDLRRSLAWYWWMPIFLGIGGIWFFLNTLYPAHSRRNLMLALAGGLCPYTAGWSFWPLYNAAGVLLGGGAVIRALDARRFAWAWGLLAGWGFSVSALTVYMPRVWSCTTLVLFLLAAEICRRRGEKPWMQVKNYIAGAGALAVMLILLLSFWWTCREEIALIARSVYPGRRFDCGGSMVFWESVKGFFAPITIYKIGMGNQSEMQAAQLYWIPLVLGAVWFRRQIRLDGRLLAPVFFLIFAFVYQYIGFPEWFAALTFWRYCTPGRVEMALVLGQIFLLAALLDQPLTGWKKKGYILGAGALSRVFFAGMILLVPREILTGFAAKIPQWLVTGIMIGIVLWYGVTSALLYCSLRWFAAAMLITGLLPAIIFNPVCIAPQKITSPAAERLEQNGKYGGRILFITLTDYLAVGGEIAGLRCLNGYFMYEDPEIWRQLLSGLPESGRFHRMNHLCAEIVSGDQPAIHTDIPANDQIRLFFHGEKYDFRRLPVDYVAISRQWQETVRHNPSLQWRFALDDVDYYAVVR
ncbi:MAG: hypothetical protein J6R85_00475 [Lentisphaeria bacterium]|nr:hypothetical protein [Lentisphaeria bacterium]